MYYFLHRKVGRRNRRNLFADLERVFRVVRRRVIFCPFFNESAYSLILCKKGNISRPFNQEFHVLFSSYFKPQVDWRAVEVSKAHKNIYLLGRTG